MNVNCIFILILCTFFVLLIASIIKRKRIMILLFSIVFLLSGMFFYCFRDDKTICAQSWNEEFYELSIYNQTVHNERIWTSFYSFKNINDLATEVSENSKVTYKNNFSIELLSHDNQPYLITLQHEGILRNKYIFEGESIFVWNNNETQSIAFPVYMINKYADKDFSNIFNVKDIFVLDMSFEDLKKWYKKINSKVLITEKTIRYNQIKLIYNSENHSISIEQA